MIVKGQKIDGRYEIVRLIGEGGMANVYLAKDTILDREVAVKILRGDLASDEKFVRRFQREANSASKLIHPNIVEVYDVGEDNGEYFIVMEYLQGKTLKNLIKKRGGLTLSETIDIMLQLTSGIACAHESYIIHRDIKPQNVLILDDGRVKITDFGISQALNSAEMTQTNSVMGSVHYLPPEQANGSAPSVKSDIYSLGILMYELLVGKVPFKGDNAVEIAMKQMRDPIPSVIDQKEDIPYTIENIIRKSTAKNPKNRYDTVMEMHDDIKTSLDKERQDEEPLEFVYPEHDLSDDTIVLSRTRKNAKKIVEDDEEEESETKSKKPLIIAGIITVVALIVGLLVFFLLINKKVPDVEIPDVTNMTVSAAEKALKKKGFTVAAKEIEQYNQDVEEGNIIKTSPSTGRTVKKGTEITLYVSKGIEGFEFENYVGQNYLTVEAILKGKGLTVKTETEEHTEDDGTKENIILKQDIEVGTIVKDGDIVTFTIPKFIVTYPDFVKAVWSLKEIQEFCTKNNITLTTKEKESSTDADGTIIYQSQPAGRKVTEGATLTVTITKKPVVVETTCTDASKCTTESSCTKSGFVWSDNKCNPKTITTTQSTGTNS